MINIIDDKIISKRIERLKHLLESKYVPNFRKDKYEIELVCLCNLKR